MPVIQIFLEQMSVTIQKMVFQVAQLSAQMRKILLINYAGKKQINQVVLWTITQFIHIKAGTKLTYFTLKMLKYVYEQYSITKNLRPKKRRR